MPRLDRRRTLAAIHKRKPINVNDVKTKHRTQTYRARAASGRPAPPRGLNRDLETFPGGPDNLARRLFVVSSRVLAMKVE